MKAIFRLAVLTLCVMALPGCMPRSNPKPPMTAAGGALENAELSNIWPFWPTHMRIHPLTRITTDEDTGQLLIEAHVEFLDVQNVTSKAVGNLTLELQNAKAADTEPVAEIWNQDLRDLTLNQRQFDVVTRTYLFRLQIDEARLAGQPELHAYFVSVDGQTMDASMKLRR